MSDRTPIPEASRAPTPAFLAGLDDDQADAVQHADGPLVVLAGPGAGKTRVIIHRIARLLAPAHAGGAGAAPESVLALAFTNKSAEEMRTRLADLVGVSAAERVRISTTHAFGRGMLRRFGDRLGLPAEHDVVDSARRKRLIRRIILDGGLYPSRGGERVMDLAAECAAFIDACRAASVSPARYAAHVAERRSALNVDDGADPVARAAERVRLDEDEHHAALFAEYEREIIRSGMLTFDDHIWLPQRLLRERPDVAAILRDECRHIVVDEFQDWNTAQIDLLTLLAPHRTDGRARPDVCVVGDDDQSIYGFRGADDRAFQRFALAYPGHAQVHLSANYRSAPPIVAAANAVISRAARRFAPDKRSTPSPNWRPDDPGASPSVEAVVGGKHTGLARSVAALIERDRLHNPDRPFHRYAVLCRGRSDLDRAAEELRLRGLPVAAIRRDDALSDVAIQDTLAWLRLVSSAGSVADAKRVLLRPPFARDPRTLAEAETRFLRAVADDTGLPHAHHDRRSARAFLAWLKDQTDLPHDAAAAGAAAGLLADFTADDALHDADATIIEIVRRLDLTNADSPDHRERHRRVRHVAALIQLARGAARHIARDEHPGAAAFLRYLDDLDPAERSTLCAQRDAGADSEIDLRENHVQVLTAHAAKGLEFDTVFVSRVSSPHGFPMSRNDAEPRMLALDPALTNVDKPDPAAEERRLFFVACTRAKRRLVLLRDGKIESGKGVTNFVAELRDAGPAVGMTVAEPPADGDAAEPDDDPSALERSSDSVRTRYIDREIARVRREASAALYDATRSGHTSAQVEALAERLADAAERLATLAHLRDEPHAPPPDFVRADDSHAHLRGYADAARRADDASCDAASIRPPLELSYYKIDTYIKCPACYLHRYVFDIQEPATPDVAFGNVLHATLMQYLDEARHAEADGLAPPPLQRLLALGRERLHADDRTGRLLPDERAAEMRRMDAQLAAAHRLRDPRANILETEKSFRFRFALGEHVHTITGSIDRIEQLPDGAYRVIDYKTGRASERLTAPKPDDLQLGLYTLALHAIFPADDADDAPISFSADNNPDISSRIPRGEAVYWALSTGESGAIPLRDIDTAKIRSRIADVARGILAGDFRRKDRTCKGICTMLLPNEPRPDV